MGSEEEQRGLTPGQLEERGEPAGIALTGAEILPEEAFARLRQVEAALAECENRFQTAERIADLGSWERDLSTNQIQASEGFRRIFGLEMQRPFHDYEKIVELIHPEDRKNFLETTRRVLKEGKPFGWDYRIIRPDKAVRTIHVRGEIIVDEAGRPAKVRGIAQDITERRQAEAALRKAEERFRALVEHSADGVGLLNAEGVTVYASPAMSRIFGLSMDKVKNLRFDLIHPDDCEDVKNAWNRLRATPSELISYQYRFRHRDGSWHWLDVTAHSRLSDPSVQAVVVNFRDITERKRAEQAINFQAHLLDTVEQAAIATDLEGKIIYWNKFAEELYGWPAEAVVGRNILEVTPTQATREQGAAIMASLKEGKSWSGEFMVQRRDGKMFPAMVTDSPIYDDHGELIGIVGVSFDTTDFRRGEETRKALLQRLFTTQEEERHRIARELHDQMGQYLAALMMGLKSLERSTEVATPVRNHVVKLQELTTQFSQEVRRFALELRPTALDDLGLYAALSNYLEGWSKRNEIQIDFHSNGLTGGRLPAQVETIVYRLVQEALNNVLKHAQARHMSVIVEHRDGRVLVVLEDNGIGFDVEAAINAPAPERGLGLMGMQERVESAGGTLEIESEPGRGTTIVARIPVVAT